MPELRLAFRLLRQQPIVTLTTLVALAVGVGMATTGFTLLDAVLFGKLPFANGERFVLFDVYREPKARRAELDAQRYRLFREQAPALEHVGAFRSAAVNLELPSGEIVPISGAAMTGDSFRVFPHAPLAGRTIEGYDSQPGAAPVALLRESLWRRHFSSDPHVVGSFATISGARRIVVGVMPDGFEFPGSGEIWLPLDDPALSAAPISARVFGVLKAGVAPEAAGAQINALSQQIEGASSAAPRLRIVVMEFTEALSQGLELANLVLVTCLVLVLLVIAANIGNLVFARTVARARELAVRTALGASRARLIGQVFTEVAMLGVAAAAIGLTASQAALTWTRNTLTDMPFWVDFSASPRTMLFVAGVTVLTACVGGVAPALRATRRNPAEALAATTRGAASGLGRLASALVTVQVALSIALLNSALLMARGVAGYMNPTVDLPAHEVLTARLVSKTATASTIEQAVARMPGVVAAGVSSSLRFSGQSW